MLLTLGAYVVAPREENTCIADFEIIFDVNECAQAAAALGYTFRKSSHDGLQTLVCILCESCAPAHAHFTPNHRQMGSLICRNRCKELL